MENEKFVQWKDEKVFAKNELYCERDKIVQYE